MDGKICCSNTTGFINVEEDLLYLVIEREYRGLDGRICCSNTTGFINVEEDLLYLVFEREYSGVGWEDMLFKYYRVYQCR